MKLKIQMNVPKGHATKTELKLRGRILKKIPKEGFLDTHVSEDEGRIMWVIESEDIGLLTKIQRKFVQLDVFVKTILRNKRIGNLVKNKWGESAEEERERILNDHINIEPISS